jgi:sugar O-acyltransferase (sialic acid O-acetyltransferase NeuD family)
VPRLVIYGAGGFGRQVLTSAARENVVLMDDAALENGGDLGAVPPSELRDDDLMVIAVSNWRVRLELSKRFGRFTSYFAKTAVIASNVEIGEGAIFCDFTLVETSARVGRHFHCNVYSYVAHDCVIGDFVTFAPRVCCNGNVHVEDGAYIGTGAIIKQGVPGRPLIIGRGAVVGMGAVVTKSVAPGETVVGNPAKPLQSSAL